MQASSFIIPLYHWIQHFSHLPQFSGFFHGNVKSLAPFFCIFFFLLFPQTSWVLKFHLAVSGPITSGQIVGETGETMTDFILGDYKITADGDCSHEIKRHLLLGRKAMTNLDSILKAETLLYQQRSI